MDFNELLYEINELAKKRREVGLTPEEEERRKELHEEYLKGLRAQVRRKLDNIDVTYPDGTVRPLRDAMKKDKEH